MPCAQPLRDYLGRIDDPQHGNVDEVWTVTIHLWLTGRGVGLFRNFMGSSWEQMIFQPSWTEVERPTSRLDGWTKWKAMPCAQSWRDFLGLDKWTTTWEHRYGVDGNHPFLIDSSGGMLDSPETPLGERMIFQPSWAKVERPTSRLDGWTKWKAMPCAQPCRDLLGWINEPRHGHIIEVSTVTIYFWLTCWEGCWTLRKLHLGTNDLSIKLGRSGETNVVAGWMK